MSLIVAVALASFAGSFLCSLCEALLYGVTTTQVELLRRRSIADGERCEDRTIVFGDVRQQNRVGVES